MLHGDPKFKCSSSNLCLVNVVCHTCFKRQEKLHRCGQCKFAHYCDRTCQKDAWLNHKNECSAIKRYGKVPNENIRLAARVMWRVEREGGGLTEGCLVSVDDLQSHVEHFGEEEKKELRGDVDAFLQYWPPQSQQFSMQYISRIFGVINCNGFTLSDQRGLQAVGVGIFPNLGLVNHDCCPNCTVIFNNGKGLDLQVTAVPRLAVTSEHVEGAPSDWDLSLVLESSPAFHVASESASLGECKKQLKKQYYFDCTCERCQKGLKDNLFLGVKDDPKVK
ncbi:Histone-lysine N-methyltransferase SMYD1, partial [Eschrichtius robustus]|nr:Histone-lysine N-methyltransferase SMYD1 [Eschrichtius robustus]